MTKTDVLNYYREPGESDAAACRRVATVLRVSWQAVYKYPERLAGPHLFAVQCALEKITGGELLADEADRLTEKEATALRRQASQPPAGGVDKALASAAA